MPSPSLHHFRREHVGRLIAELHRDFSTRIRERLAEAGHDGLSDAHLKLLRNLPTKGARLSTLAGRLGITAQSAGARVGELEALGLLERREDPDDGRATTIRFSTKGRRLLGDARGLIHGIEREWAKALGPARFEAMKASLAELVTTLRLDVPA